MSKQSKFVKNKLYLYWQAETVRLYESQHTGIDDSNIENLIKSKYTQFDQRILYRAQLIAKQEDLNQALAQWSLSAKLSIAILWLLAFLSGAGVASGALANENVNLASALIALLGLHLISFIIWLTAYLPVAKPGTGLSGLWLWLNRKLTKKGKSTLAGQAFLALFMRHKLWRPAVGIITNSTWLVAFIGALFSLLILLGTRNYSFHWATTLLSDNAFIQISKLIGSVPAVLGFPLPDDAAITASLDSFSADRSIQTQWSIWLIGCVIVWGLLPRLIALLLCLLSLLSKISKLKISDKPSVYLDLANKYQTKQQHMGIDRPASKINHLIRPAILKNKSSGKAAVLGFELATDFTWPPAQLQTGITDLGICASRNEQNQIRKKLHNKTDLLLICNTELTPDRGTINWLHELQDLTASLKIYCPPGSRSQLWQQALASNGFTQTDSMEQWQTDLKQAGIL